MNPQLRSLLRKASRAVGNALRTRLASPRPRTDDGRSPSPAPSPRTAGRDSQRPGGRDNRSSRPRTTDGEPSPYGSASAREYSPGAELPQFDYQPHNDNDADPGEVVWTWVPYEDDPSVGKDRPVLVLARLRDDVVVLQMTSQDRDKDRADEARWGRYWFDIGSGNWDNRGRESEVRLDRLLRVGQGAIRREGGVLDRHIFDQVIAAVEDAHRRGL